MLIFCETGYGNGAIFVTPGADLPADPLAAVKKLLGRKKSIDPMALAASKHPEWFKVTLTEGKQTLQALQITVKFREGMADVSDALGKYLVDKGYAAASPLPIRVPTTVSSWEDVAIIKYKKPIAVGQPLAEIYANARDSFVTLRS